MARKKPTPPALQNETDYQGLYARIAALLEQGRRATVRTTNAILTATYWEVGRQTVEYEQGGKARAVYGEELWKRLAADLTANHGRGFPSRISLP